MGYIAPRSGAAHNEEEIIKLREQYKPNAFDFKLGLGGWAQLKNKRAHDPETKAKLDHEYVKYLSLWLDIKIFVLKVLHLFGSGRGKNSSFPLLILFNLCCYKKRRVARICL